MHKDGENSREFKYKVRAGNQRITNFETFQCEKSSCCLYNFLVSVRRH